MPALRTAPGAGTGEVLYCASTTTGPVSGAGIWRPDVGWDAAA
ncbi:MAG TPA: hypothetical protein VF003_04835 [Pseudonocardiaceae bacterium]